MSGSQEFDGLEGSSKERSIMTVAVSSRALFSLEEENELFKAKGQVAFDEHMLQNAAKVLKPGVAFPVVRRLLGLNSPGRKDRVTVIVLSRNSPAAGLRVMQSINALGLDIQKAVFTSGAERFRYAEAMGAHLFLSANEADVQSAAGYGIAAAAVVPMELSDDGGEALRVAFDGDSTVLGSSSDEVFRLHGLAKFREHETLHADVPIEDGPFRPVLERMVRLRASLGERSELIRLALVTARGVSSPRAMKTLMSWGLNLDESVFADGEDKGAVLKAFGAHIYFDDTKRHVDSAVRHLVPAGRVLSGVTDIAAPVLQTGQNCAANG
jgi:5'-nucleotidase